VSNDNDDFTIHRRGSGESAATGWFVAIIVALALLAVGYLVFSANSTPSAAPAAQVTQQ
jgi:hypothetical protein